MQCFQEQGQPSLEFIPVEMRDDGLYSVTCSNGHTTVTAIQEQKFEIVFDLGVMALLDGYPREAATSMASALERFYEFYINVIALKHGICDKALSDTWKHVSAQSERQFGAFLYMYLIDHRTDCCPTIDNDKPELEGISKNQTKTWKEFRNAVVHKGYIPSSSETLAYGNLIYRYIYDLIEDLKINSAEHIQQVTFKHLSRAQNVDVGVRISTMSIPTIISLIRGEVPPDTLEKALESLKEYRKWLHHH